MAEKHVIVIHSSAGGVGKSLLALHLAYLYAGKGLSTVLVDLAQYGSVAPRLQLPRGLSSGVSGMITALEEGGVGDERLRDGLVPAPGVDERLQLVLSSGPARMDRIQSTQAELLLHHLGRIADVVVVDTGSELVDRTLGAFLAATQIVLVVPPTVVAGWQTLELLDLLRSAYIGQEKLGLVFGRVGKGGRYSLDEFAQVLGLPVLGAIPELRGLPRLADGGLPPDVQKRSALTHAIRQVAHHLIPVFTPKELKRPWLSRR